MTVHAVTLHPRQAPGALSDWAFEQFRRMIFDVAGIDMSPAKRALVSGRLAKRIAQLGLDGYEAYYRQVARDPAERQVAVDLLTTNETYFFREPQHFEFLAQTVVPTLPRLGGVRVWCGASSSGEEPYTIAMTLAQALGHGRFEVLASDISSRMLDVARTALYPVEDAQGIPGPLRIRHCLRGVGRQAGSFTFDRSIRDKVTFMQINLNASLPELGLFDVIFLRNVMIYFNPQTKREVLARLVPLLRPGGWLFVSHSESLGGLTEGVRAVQPSIYRKPVAA